MSADITMEFKLVYDESGKLSLAINPNDHPSIPSKTVCDRTVLFTGFKANDRAKLEKIAVEYKFVIRKTVSHMLTVLVAGPNAGPAKIENAKCEGAHILTEQEFFQLCETGELPLRK